MARKTNAPKQDAPPAPVSTKSPEELLLEKAIEISNLTADEFDALSPDEQAPHLAAAKTALEQDSQAPAAPKAPKEEKVKLVKMKRDAEQYPEGPHEAEVHPDEVENYKAGGFVTV